MDALRFFLRHAAGHLGREPRRTAFVLFCIAAGVAAVVALRSLGLMLTDAMLGDLQASNRADIKLGMPASLADEALVDRSLFDSRGEATAAQFIWLSGTGERRLGTWAAARGFELMPRWSNSGPFACIRRVSGEPLSEDIVVLGVDPARYPFYGRINFAAPGGATLAQTLARRDAVVVDANVARKLGLQPGEQVSITGAPGAFTVTGIVDPQSEASLLDPLTALYSFVYVPYDTVTSVFRKHANLYYLRVPAGSDLAAIKEEIVTNFRGLQPTTTDDVREVNRQLSDLLTRLVTVMGVVSLLIGGIGIANTMTVVVSRRMLEIAVLKTVGVQGSQIALMFIVEAVVLGALGSLLGVPLGLAMVLALRGAGERLVGQAVEFGVYPEAVAMGLALGILVTVVFGLLPILAAARVRPNLVLRPEGADRLPAGRFSALVLLALTAVMGLVVGQIVGNALAGVALAYATLLVLGLGMAVLRGVVWVLCRLPTFGLVPLKLAQRAMGAHAGRVANTLLALVIGVFALSLIWLLAQSIFTLVSVTLEDMLQGNMLVTVEYNADGAALERLAARLPGVTGLKHDSIYEAEIIAINGNQDMDALIRQARQRAGGVSLSGDVDSAIDGFVKKFDMKVLDDSTWPYSIAEGVDIRSTVETDPGLILLEPRVYGEAVGWFDLKPGDTLTVRFPGGAKRTATIAGVTSEHYGGALLALLIDLRAAYSIVPERLVPDGEEPRPSLYMLSVKPELMNETLDAVMREPGIFAVSTMQLNSYASRFAERFVPLPFIVGGLTLFASGVIIANTVALAALERRRQIGIMKAIGMQAESVLGLLLLENALVGLVGGLLGVGLSAGLILAANVLPQGTPIAAGALGWLLVLAVALALGATLLTAWGAVHEKPMHVLRYE